MTRLAEDQQVAVLLAANALVMKMVNMELGVRRDDEIAQVAEWRASSGVAKALHHRPRPNWDVTTFV
jgi:hypothetical protein